MSLQVTLLLLLLIGATCAGIMPRKSFMVSFGSDESGRLGHSDTDSQFTVDLNCPRQICAIDEIALTSDYAVIRTAFGIYVWGSNASQELGPSETRGALYQPSRLPLPQFNGAKSESILALEDALMIISENYDIVGYGSDDDYRLALFQVRSISVPSVPSGTPSSSPSSAPDSSPSAFPPSTPVDSSPIATVTAPDGFVIAAPPGAKRDLILRSGAIEPSPNSLNCAGTRCYFRNRVDQTWGYFGAAEYDSGYAPLTVEASIQWIANSVGIVWIEATERGAVTLKLSLVPPRLELFATGFEVGLNPNVSVSSRKLDAACTPSSMDRLRAMGYGFFIYGCNEANSPSVTRVFGFGRNQFGQLGNDSVTDPYIPAIDEHIELDFSDLSPGERIVALRAGRSTGYAFTNLNKTWTWGWAGNRAMGTYTASGNWFAKPISNAFDFPQYYKYQITNIQSSPTSHGLFIVLAMKFGNCPSLPSSMEVDNNFCDYDDYINFAEDCILTEEMKGEMHAFMKMRGDVYMHGDSQMMSMAGMTMEGGITMYDRAKSVLVGNGELIGNVFLHDNSIVQFSGANVSLIGNLNVGPNAHIDLDDLAHTFEDRPAITLNGTGIIEGIVTITYSQEEIDSLVNSLLSGDPIASQSPDEAIPQASPDSASQSPDLSPDTIAPPPFFSKKSLILETTEGSLDVTRATVNIALLQPSSGCSSVTASPSVQGGSLVVIFAVSSNGGCLGGGPLSPAQALKKVNNSQKVGIIVGSVIAGVVILGALAALLILKVPPIRQAVLPYRGATARRAAASPLRTDA